MYVVVFSIMPPSLCSMKDSSCYWQHSDMVFLVKQTAAQVKGLIPMPQKKITLGSSCCGAAG